MIKLAKIVKKLLSEEISADEAHRDENAIQTVIDNRRPLGFITTIGSTLPEKTFWNLVKKYNLNTLKVSGNKHKAFIYYREGFEKEANELKDIAEKYGGYLAWNATEEDTIRIGELLNYKKEDIDDYISRNR